MQKSEVKMQNYVTLPSFLRDRVRTVRWFRNRRLLNFDFLLLPSDFSIIAVNLLRYAH